MGKSIPTVGDPDNFNAFSGIQTYPRQVTRGDAAKALVLMRHRARCKQGSLERISDGHYRLVGLNTTVLTTR